MVKTRELDLKTKGAIIALRNEGYSYRQIGERLNLAFSTVGYVVRRFASTQTHLSKPRTGRPRSTTISLTSK